MEIGNFCFIKDQYFIDFPDDKLQSNNEVIDGQPHNRPCYFVTKDKQNPLIYWVVPISSRVPKYERIYEDKISRFKKCDTLHFGFVRGQKTAFLIQNMCPVTVDYINNKYIDATTGNPVVVSSATSKAIEQKVTRVLSLHSQGKKLIFPDINKIKSGLLSKLEPEIPIDDKKDKK